MILLSCNPAATKIKPDCEWLNKNSKVEQYIDGRVFHSDVYVSVWRADQSGRENGFSHFCTKFSAEPSKATQAS
jgi:hypothetical protein